MQPKTCILYPSLFNAIPPTNAPIEKTGPGIALITPDPVKKSSLSIFNAPGFTFSARSVAALRLGRKGALHRQRVGHVRAADGHAAVLRRVGGQAVNSAA